MKSVRKLNANEIEVKPCQVDKDHKWVQILLYKTSRVDMQILTEMYGLKWKSSYQMVGDSLFCTISVWDDELKEWISRTDCGEKDAGISEEKSYATSAFKRAATQFGIGAELYNTPRIRINTPDKYYFNNKLCMTFTVKDIEFEENNCVKLVITDKFGNIVYNWTDETVPERTRDEINGADSIQALTDIWAANQRLQTSQEFKRLMSAKKKSLS